MRQIKFRAWDKLMQQHLPNVQNHINDKDWAFGIMLKNHDRFIIEQFTGLADKNGKEIYEGDVMCWPQYEGTKHQMRWAVEYNPLRGFCSWSPVEQAEIIGNIHENPELLNPHNANK